MAPGLRVDSAWRLFAEWRSPHHPPRPERRPGAVRELADEGLSTRAIGGIGHATVARDLAVSDETVEDGETTVCPEDDHDAVSNETDSEAAKKAAIAEKPKAKGMRVKRIPEAHPLRKPLPRKPRSFGRLPPGAIMFSATEGLVVSERNVS